MHQHGKFLVQLTEESSIDGGFFKTCNTVTLDEDGYFLIQHCPAVSSPSG
jgi:hypothetical protein